MASHRQATVVPFGPPGVGGMGHRSDANLKAAFKRSLMSRVGYLFAAPSLNKMRKRLDPRSYNGAMLVGLNGVVVKSHGGTDAIGYANAIGVAADMAAGQFNAQIIRDLKTFMDASTPVPVTEAAAS